MALVLGRAEFGGSLTLPTTLPTATTSIGYDDYNQKGYTGTIPTEVSVRLCARVCGPWCTCSLCTCSFIRFLKANNVPPTSSLGS